jgi:hypothetical protein
MRYHDQCNLAICHTVSQPVNFTWQCVIRYHNQCISPGNVLCGTTTSAFHLAMCHAVPRPVQPSNISYGTTTSVFHLAMCYTVPQPGHCCSLCGLLQRFCSILCRSIIKMATISREYVNLLPPWYFKITLSYIIHVLVLYQGDVCVCRFEIVTNQGPIKLKQVITWRCIQ